MQLFRFNPGQNMAFADIRSVTPRKVFTELGIGTADGSASVPIRYKDGALYIEGHLLVRGEVCAWTPDGETGEIVTGLRLGDLADVEIGSPAAGECIVWDGTRWVNGAAAAEGIDEESLAAYLTEHSYITSAALQNFNADRVDGYHVSSLLHKIVLGNQAMDANGP